MHLVYFFNILIINNCCSSLNLTVVRLQEWPGKVVWGAGENPGIFMSTGETWFIVYLELIDS